jgi:hypothetical protein
VSTEPGETGRLGDDSESRLWVDKLRSGHPRREEAVGTLRGVLVRVAFDELSRRRVQLGSIADHEYNDLAQQAADDALTSIMRELDEFRGPRRFTTWTIDGEKLEPLPGQTVLPHGPDRNLSVDEIGAVQLVEPANSGGPSA